MKVFDLSVMGISCAEMYIRLCVYVCVRVYVCVCVCRFFYLFVA